MANRTIIAAGGDNEEKIEYAPDIMSLVDHFCDSLDQVEHTGMVHQAIEKGYIKKSDLKPIGGLITGKCGFDNGRHTKMGLSTGVALEDFVNAVELYEFMKEEKPPKVG
jgi:ornithine cyclodeaminase/alanine dehydrogenase-like protein (mu-crystallin family)